MNRREITITGHQAGRMGEEGNKESKGKEKEINERRKETSTKGE